MKSAPFTGPATDYLPKPDNGPALVEPGNFIPLTEAETKAARLAVEQHKRRLLDATPVPPAPRAKGADL